MLIKVKHRETKKYVKLEEVSFTDFMSAGKLYMVYTKSLKRK